MRKKAKPLTSSQIQSGAIQKLIRNMRHTLISKKLGIGLAAPQIGKPVALSVIAVRPTEHRPKVKKFDLVLINPKISQVFGMPKQKWEGCISAGAGEANLFGKVERYSKVKVSFLNEKGESTAGVFSGLVAQVIQHETDHLNGVLFVDHVKDPKTYMTMHEYKKRIKKIK